MLGKLKKILQLLNKHKDKQLHLLYCLMMTMFIMSIIHLTWLSIIASLSVVLVVSLLKQYLDFKHLTGKFSIADIIAGLSGWFWVMLCFFMCKHFTLFMNVGSEKILPIP